MIEVTTPTRVARSAAHAFDVVIRHQTENHPRWEDEVVEVRDLDDLIGVGHRSVMVRAEHGRTREVVNECVEYVEGRRAAYLHTDSVLDFWIAFDFVDLASDGCEVTATVRITPKGPLRVMTPLLRWGAPKRGARISRRMGEVIEATPAYEDRGDLETHRSA